MRDLRHLLEPDLWEIRAVCRGPKRDAGLAVVDLVLTLGGRYQDSPRIRNQRKEPMFTGELPQRSSTRPQATSPNWVVNRDNDKFLAKQVNTFGPFPNRLITVVASEL